MAKIALLIGVSEYEQGLNPLAAATKDVEAMKAILLDPNKCGFDEVNLNNNGNICCFILRSCGQFGICYICNVSFIYLCFILFCFNFLEMDLELLGIE